MDSTLQAARSPMTTPTAKIKAKVNSNPSLTGGLVFAIILGLLILGGVIALFVWYMRNLRKYNPRRKYRANGYENEGYAHEVAMGSVSNSEPSNGSDPKQRVDINSIFSVINEHGTGHYNPAGNRRPKSRKLHPQDAPFPLNNDSKELSSNKEKPTDMNKFDSIPVTGETKLKTPLIKSDFNNQVTVTSDSDDARRNTLHDSQSPGDVVDKVDNDYKDALPPDGARASPDNVETGVDVIGGVENPDQLFQNEKWAVSGERQATNDEFKTDFTEGETMVQNLQGSPEIEDLDSKWDISKMNDDFIDSTEDIKCHSQLHTETDYNDRDSLREWDLCRPHKKRRSVDITDESNIRTHESEMNDSISSSVCDLPQDTGNVDRWATSEHVDEAKHTVVGGDCVEARAASTHTASPPSLHRTLVVQDTRLEELDDFTDGSFSLCNETDA